MENKPAPIEVKVTWGLAWALWWRWLLLSLVAGLVLWLPIVVLLALFGINI